MEHDPGDLIEDVHNTATAMFNNCSKAQLSPDLNSASIECPIKLDCVIKYKQSFDKDKGITEDTRIVCSSKL